MYFVSHLNTAIELLRSYQGEEPFHVYLKKYFRAHPKHGSRDRRRIGQFCYAAWRMGKSAQTRSWQEQIAAGLFLSSNTASPELDYLQADWNQQTNIPWKDKWTLLQLDANQVFPWKTAYSEGMDDAAFTAAFFRQPLVFGRVRPGKTKEVEAKLKDTAHQWIAPDTVAVENNFRLQDYVSINRDLVIQDLSSQRVGNWIDRALLPSQPRVWDCCAASGGKTILLADRLPGASIFVSDIRASILKNLDSRLAEADVRVEDRLLTDLSRPDAQMPSGMFDLLLADVPCTGSGTWGRTPEQLYFFDADRIREYAGLQARLLDQAVTRVKTGGYLLYCTCSVFQEENEAQVARLVESGRWHCVGQELITGYEQRADTLYAALLQKN